MQLQINRFLDLYSHKFLISQRSCVAPVRPVWCVYFLQTLQNEHCFSLLTPTPLLPREAKNSEHGVIFLVLLVVILVYRRDVTLLLNIYGSTLQRILAFPLHFGFVVKSPQCFVAILVQFHELSSTFMRPPPLVQFMLCVTGVNGPQK